MSEHEHTNRRSDGDGLTDADVDRALATSLDRGHRLVLRRRRRRAAVSGLAVVALFAGGFGILNSLSTDGGEVRVTPAIEGTSVERSTLPTTTVPTSAVPTSDVFSLDTTIAPDPVGSGGQVSAPAASATTTPPVPTFAPQVTRRASPVPADPAGYERVDLPGGVTELINHNPPPPEPTTTTMAGGAVDVGAPYVGDRGVSVSRADAIRTFRFISPQVLRVEPECDPGTEVASLRYRRTGSEVTVQVSSRGIYLGASCTTGVRPPMDLVFPAGDLPRNVRVVAGILDE